MQNIYRVMARLMATDLTVLIFGETGTGKELVARALHDYGTRRRGPFVAVNCAAIPRELLESELFGHEKGAFTGAVTRGKRAASSRPHGGTLFLDEIGEMPLDAAGQAAARAAGAASSTAVGGAHADRGRRARHRRHPSRSAPGDPRRASSARICSIA